MALTITKNTDQGATNNAVWGSQRVRTVTLTFDSTYPDNGEPLTAADVGLTKIVQVIPALAVKNDGSDAFPVWYDFTNAKLLAFKTGGAAQAALPENTTADISAYSARVTFIGY